MEYIKFNIDEMYQEMVFCQYREIKDGQKSEMISRAFPFSILKEKEPKIAELVVDEIIGVYYEQRGENNKHSEVIYIDHTVEMSQEDIDWCIDFTKKVCLDKIYDDLLKPPSVDEQVEDFIKEFFEGEEDSTTEKKDFLADFFAELEQDSEPSTNNNKLKEMYNNEAEEPFEQKDFLADFFAEIEDENSKE